MREFSLDLDDLIFDIFTIMPGHNGQSRETWIRRDNWRVKKSKNVGEESRVGNPKKTDRNRFNIINHPWY